MSSNISATPEGAVVHLNSMNVACFMSLAGSRNLKATAETLNINKSAVVQNIKRLEDELGVSLFIPGSQTVILTRAGKKFYEFFLGFENDMRSTHVELSRSGIKRELRIVMSEYIACPDWFTEALKAFQREHPEIEVLVYQASPANSLSMFTDGRMDALLSSRYLTRSIHTAAKIDELDELPLYLLVSADGPYAKLERDDFKKYDIPHYISYADEDNADAVKQRDTKEFIRDLLVPKQLKIEDNLDNVYLAVRMGLGTAVSPMNNKLKNSSGVFKTIPIGRSVTLCLTQLQSNDSPENQCFDTFIHGYRGKDS